MIDIDGWMRDTHREIGKTTIAAGEARTALIRRRYDAAIEDVWDACTNPERVNRWLLPLTGDLRPGGTFHLEGNASGKILRCEPPRLLRLTWAYGDRPVDEVGLRLSPAEDGVTLLELEHATITTTVEWERREVDVITGLGPGWEPALAVLETLLSGDWPDIPGVEWMKEASPAELEEIQRFGERLTREWAALLGVSPGATP
jgi:uncharacterized protein YndB with AHSA1/START domain